MSDIRSNELWAQTQQDLIEGRYSRARAGLDELASRDDVYDLFGDPSAYNLPSDDYGKLLSDRIELVNTKAERNAENVESLHAGLFGV